MPHCTCSMLVDLFPRGIEELNQTTTSLGEVLKAYEDIFLGHPEDEPAIREKVCELLDRNHFFAADMDQPPSQVPQLLLPMLQSFAQEYVARRQKYDLYWALPKTTVAQHLADESSFTDDPDPTCVRWGWVNGQIVCEYNYGIALVPKVAGPGSSPLEQLSAMTGGAASYHINMTITGAFVDDVWP